MGSGLCSFMWNNFDFCLKTQTHLTENFVGLKEGFEGSFRKRPRDNKTHGKKLIITNLLSLGTRCLNLS